MARERIYTITWTSLGLKVILLANLSIWRELLQYIICVACVIYNIYFNSVIVKDEFIVVLRDFAGLSRPTFEPFGVSAFDFWIIQYIVIYTQTVTSLFYCVFFTFCFKIDLYMYVIFRLRRYIAMVLCVNFFVNWVSHSETETTTYDC